jgi:hypothetical protein
LFNRVRRRAGALAAVAVVLAIAPLHARTLAPLSLRALAPFQAAWTAQLGGVEASGSKRIPAAQVVALAGLKIGSTIGPRDVEAAQQRLLASGYFRSVGSSFRNAGYSVIVTFALEDVVWKTPIVFDNFVDHSDAQLVAAVARDVPSFDGVAPDRDVVLKRIAASLERLARESSDPGVVSYAMAPGPSGGADHWRFHLDRASGPLPVCAVMLTGITGAEPPALNDRKAALIGIDYSKDRMLQIAKETFVPLLGAPAAVRRIDARRAPAAANCARGVAVTIVLGTGLFSTVSGV